MSKIIATVLLTLGLLASSSAAALACGDTPGFCPNPPPGKGCDWFYC